MKSTLQFNPADDIEHEEHAGVDDSAIANAFESALDSTGTSVSVPAEADTAFYARVMASCTDGISLLDKQLEDINNHAERLLESKKQLTADRQRLLKQRHAARISMRYLEDSEAGR